MNGRICRALTIAGSDSGGGAGVQGDLKTFQAFGVYGMTVVTAITAQNSLGVQRSEPVVPMLIEAQLDSVLGDIGADAVKTGMLPTPEAAAAAAAALRRYGVSRLVVDPVRTAKDGFALAAGSTFETAARLLWPLAELATPNMPEAAALLGVREAELAAKAARVEAARALLAWGPRYVLLKGGHGAGDDSVDVLVAAADDGAAPLLLSASRLETRHSHGTGCALSAAVCAALAQGDSVPEACRRAKAFVTAAIAGSFPLGAGIGSLRHDIWRAH